MEAMAVLEKQQQFDFQNNGIEVMNFETLQRTYKENDIYGKPVQGIYHYQVLQRMMDICEKYNLDYEVEEIFAAQNRNKTQPGVSILPQVELLLPKIDSILGGLQTLVNHPALAQSLNNIETTTNSLAVSSRQLNQMLSKDVPGIMSDLKVITGNFADVSTDLKKLDLATTVNAVNATLDNVEQMTRKLNSKDNSMGLLLNDRALYDNLNSTADNASKLLLDLRQNPKRYVHFSVF